MEEKTFDINFFTPLCHPISKVLFYIGSDIEFLLGNIVHISMLGTIIESFLFNIECFINQYLPYIDVVYDL